MAGSSVQCWLCLAIPVVTSGGRCQLPRGLSVPLQGVQRVAQLSGRLLHDT